MAGARGTGWAGVLPAEAVAKLRKRWNEGEFLRVHAAGNGWQPVSLSLRPPTARQLGDNLEAVTAWAGSWRRARSFRLETAVLGGRLIGANEVPLRAWVDDAPTLWAVLDVREDVERFDRLRELTRAQVPELDPWLCQHPMTGLHLRSAWQQLLDVVVWMRDRAGPDVYLRQIDVPGVDTKFVDRHRTELGQLLDAVLPPERINPSFPRTDTTRRYGLARKPSHVRLRRLDGASLLPGGGPAELGLRVSDLAMTPLSIGWIIVVENETTYLALPPVKNLIAVWGAGYAVTLLAPVTWLRAAPLAYWSDIDTHGFVMLDRMRRVFPAVRSLLMDRDTLLAHEPHWGTEKVQSAETLDHLSPPEAALHRDLLENRYGDRVRLEQEHLPFPIVTAVLNSLGN